MTTVIKKIVLLSLPIVLLMLCVDYFGDAGNLFSGIEGRIATYMLSGENVVGMPNINERLLHKLLIERDRTPRSCIVLGSSRIMLIGSDHFPTESFMNHGVSGATVEDMAAIYQMCKDVKRLPRTIIIGLDPWIFNANSGQDRWVALSTECNAFLSRRRMGLNLDGFKIYSQLLSPSYFTSSVKVGIVRIAHGDRQLIRPTLSRVNDEFTRMADGSIRYDREHRSATVEQVSNIARAFVAGDLYSLENYRRFSGRSIMILRRLIADIKANGIEVEFIMTPYHPTVYEFLISHEQYRMVPEFEKYCREMATELGGEMIGSLDPERVGVDVSCFYDGMHLNERGVDVVLQPMRGIR